MVLAFHQHQLPNGLTVLAECNDQAHTSAVGFFVKTGARDEDLPVMGVSHFLEHMMFKGTARRSADDVNREFDELGANYNAFTSHENTVYWAQVLPEYTQQAVDLLGDMLRPALRDEDFEMEKNVILEEIGMYEDRPHWRLHDQLMEKYFGDSSLGYRVLGTVDSIKALTVDQMRTYFSGRYGAGNITVAAAGRVDIDQLLADVTKLTDGWQNGDTQREYQEPAISPGQMGMSDDKLNRHYLAMMCPGPSAQDPRRYAAKVLGDVLGDSEGSRLYWALVDPGVADEADFSFCPQDHVGSFVAFASCDPERAEQVEQTLLETLDQYAQSIKSDEIERAKNKLATLATLQDENPCGRMRSLGMQWTYLKEYLPLEVELQRLMAVTVDDVKSLVAQMPFQPRTVVRLGP